MNENLLKTIYFLLGAGKAGEKKLKELIEEIILNSEFTQEEGERIYKEIKAEINKETEFRTSQFYSFVDDLLSTLNLPDRNSLRENAEKVYADFSKNTSFLKNKNTKLTIVKK